MSTVFHFHKPGDQYGGAPDLKKSYGPLDIVHNLFHRQINDRHNLYSNVSEELNRMFDQNRQAEIVLDHLISDSSNGLRVTNHNHIEIIV
ncbi:hypothetical protein PoB_001144500 [Plakobranchus ocellatus]|uniref:Uncharacterized protein n=1 Tax=Plakobranchus ocellatus TaxID=259542 RepID=A0AAV3YR72_9GAST|nr:hypothetical protein PoB_001144500 [Plakobranchus ocellatus]